MKLNRNYKLYIQRTLNSQDFLEIDYPLTIQFNISRGISGAANSMDLQVYNLSQKNYSWIAQDSVTIQNIVGQVPTYRKIILLAGYDRDLSVIFVGNIIEAYTMRAKEDLITSIHALDGVYGMINSYSSFSVIKGSFLKDVFLALVDSLKGNNIELGKITNIDGAIQKDTVYTGNSFNLIKENFSKQVSVNLGTGDYSIIERDVFVDNEKIHILDKRDYIKLGKLFVINSDTGLLGVPRRKGSIIEISIIFEPKIEVAQLIELQSSVDKRFNGQYKVLTLKHSGTISGAISGDLTTTLELDIGTNLLGGLNPV